MNIFIIFVNFLDWIVAIWVRLVKLIEEKEGLTVKMKHRIIKKNIRPRGTRPPPRSVLVYKLSTQ